MLIPSFTYSFLYIYPYYNTVGRQKRFCSFRNPKKKQNGQFFNPRTTGPFGKTPDGP